MAKIIKIIFVFFLVSLSQSTASENTVKTSINILGLYGLDISKDQFNVNFKINLLSRKPIKDVKNFFEISNASEATISPGIAEQVGDSYYYTAYVKATILNNFNLKRFPFDKQELKISIEALDHNTLLETQADAVSLEPSFGFDKGAWSITKVVAESKKVKYPSTFGVGNDESRQFSRINVSIDMERNRLSAFFDEILFIYLIFSFAAFSILLKNGARMHLALVSCMLLFGYYLLNLCFKGATVTYGLSSLIFYGTLLFQIAIILADRYFLEDASHKQKGMFFGVICLTYFLFNLYVLTIY